MTLAALVLVAGVPQPATAACTGESQFEADRFVDQRGDHVRVRLEHCGTGDRTIEIAGPGYSARVSVEDRTGDDLVTLLVNTYAPGEDGFAVANPTDDFFVRGVDWDGGQLPTGEYSLTAVKLSSAGREVEDDATMVVEDRSPGRLSDLTAPAGTVLSTPAAVRAARADGTVANRTPFPDDLAVLVLESSGLGGALAAQAGPNATARFFAMTDGSPASFRVVEAAETVEVEAEPIVLPLGPGPTTRVVPDHRNDTYYVVVDLAAAIAREADDEDSWEVDVGDVFVANLSIPADSPLSTGAPESATTRFRVAERSASVAGLDPSTDIYVTPGENLSVNGTTNVRPGHTLQVVVREPGSTTGFRRRTETTVRADGGFSTTLDLSHRTDGEMLALSVEFDGRELLTDQMTVLVDEPRASVRLANQSLDGTTLTVERVELSRPGFVAVHRGGPDGPVVGVSRLLSPLPHADVTVSIEPGALAGNGSAVPVAAVAYRDGDRDGSFTPTGEADPAFERNRRPVSDGATVEVPGTPTATPTPGTPVVTPTPRATPTSGTPGTVSNPSPTPPTASDGGPIPGDPLPDDVPGFGPVAAVVAVLAALGLARRS